MNRKKAIEAYEKQLFLERERSWMELASRSATPAEVTLTMIGVMLSLWAICEVVAWMFGI